MRTVKELNLKGKRVLLRCDFDVPLTETGDVSDDFRIQRALPTIEYLIKKGAKVILVAHLGRPNGKVVEGMRLTPVQDKLMEYLDLSITKAPDCIGPEVENFVSEMQEGEVLLLENLRFHKEEEDNDENFARKLARFADFYINDAFASSHRGNASITLLPKYLPSAAGLLLEKEMKVLSRVLENPWRPLVVIIGGVKIDSKIAVIEKFLEQADHLLLGGQIANTILIAKGITVGKQFLETEILKRLEKVDITNQKLHLPVDGLIALENRFAERSSSHDRAKHRARDEQSSATASAKASATEEYLRTGGVGSVKKEESVFDIGPETIKVFSEVIKSAKMILWSGPLGMFEEKKFERGTKDIAESITRNHPAFKVAGGGDTTSALNKFGLLDKFDHVSTGGGAMLEFVSGKRLPGLDALNKYGD